MKLKPNLECLQKISKSQVKHSKYLDMVHDYKHNISYYQNKFNNTEVYKNKELDLKRLSNIDGLNIKETQELVLKYLQNGEVCIKFNSSYLIKDSKNNIDFGYKLGLKEKPSEVFNMQFSSQQISIGSIIEEMGCNLMDVKINEVSQYTMHPTSHQELESFLKPYRLSKHYQVKIEDAPQNNYIFK